ncbi:MAG: Tol-Pal system beta propeller repeat protein TolB [Chromatiales bacterium]|jgi:TolB protein|nr:Tol-Pal system beta propeller repeat protein TolB [Chromatiales bacterium]MDX9766480.1 Tol-Pal system beta propeller repeat protein TolB [Ectothiorhodospiraceae bacterium]
MDRYTPLKYLLLWLLCLAVPAQAALEIRITQGVEGALPVAIVPFGWPAQVGTSPLDVAAVVSADLHRSGLISPLPVARMPERPTRAAELDVRKWRQQRVDYVAIGQLIPASGGRYNVQFQLFDTISGEQLMGYSIPAEARTLRQAAHHVSDLIFERLTGKRGAFNTRVAFVSAQRSQQGGSVRSQYMLQVADADGYNPRTIFRSGQPIMSPMWSPDGRRLAYVSFEGRRPAIWVQNIDGGERQRIAAFPGINGAPAWSPDGSKIAMTLSKDGAPNIYVYDLPSQRLIQITNTNAIDTEARWMPDGRSLVFTSDRAGSPQIYQVGLDGQDYRARRLTFEGNYNAAVSVSPDGKTLAMVHGGGGRYRIATLNLHNGNFRVLTEGRLDESPSFAPNGSMILYATDDRGRGVLAAVSEDGRVRQELILQDAEVREPAWSPFLN